MTKGDRRLDAATSTFRFKLCGIVTEKLTNRTWVSNVGKEPFTITIERGDLLNGK